MTLPPPDVAPPEIRPEEPGDAALVRDVVLRAFGPGEEVVAELVDALRASSARLDAMSFLAWSDDGTGAEPVGHVLLTRGWVDAPERLVEVLVLSPLGVVPERQGRGVGTALVRHALAAADAAGWPLLFLEGDPGYYVRHGFEPAGARGFAAPSDRIPAAAFQVVRLRADEPWMRGRLVYPDPFWALDCVGLRP
ncbi:GNAT family N-acetyltransferase [Cellulosimicrobium sp. Marseille-Q8652]